MMKKRLCYRLRGEKEKFSEAWFYWKEKRRKEERQAKSYSPKKGQGAGMGRAEGLSGKSFQNLVFFSVRL
jgi:hypothetical protein